MRCWKSPRGAGFQWGGGGEEDEEEENQAAPGQKGDEVGMRYDNNQSLSRTTVDHTLRGDLRDENGQGTNSGARVIGVRCHSD